MSYEDINNARRLLQAAEQHCSSIGPAADKARVKAQIAVAYCQIHQAERR